MTTSQSFFGRRVDVDVFITVHRALEASTMCIQRLQAPLTAEPLALRTRSDSVAQRAAVDPDLETSLRALHEDRHCLLAMDVHNIYGQPFDVTFERHSDGMDPLANRKLLICLCSRTTSEDQAAR